MLLRKLFVLELLLQGVLTTSLTDIEWKTKEFQAVLQSTEPFEAKENPIPIAIFFSQDVEEFNESYIIIENGVISSFYKISDQEFHISLLVTQPGSVSVSLADQIRSQRASTIHPSPSLSFYYEGTTILSQSVTKISETEARLLLITNKPAILYSYITQSTSVPTEKEIVSRGSIVSMVTPTSYSIDFSSLLPSTTYFVYTTGKELPGTLIASTIQETTVSFRTKGAPSKCATTLILTSTGELIEAICNNRGECESGSCICERGYSGTACSTIDSEPFNNHAILHGIFVFTISLPHADELTLYIQNSLHEVLASYCGVDYSAIQIRDIEITQSKSPTERRVQIQMTLLAEKEKGHLFKEELENEQMEEEITSSLLSRNIALTGFENKRIEVLSLEDDWRCHNGLKEDWEGDVDCGGPCIRKCIKDQTCNHTTDCESDLECKASRCEQTPAVVPVLGICICVICVFLFVGTLISQIQGKRTINHFEQLKDGGV